MTTAVIDSKSPRCLSCDYPLVGLLEHRCPECGRTFDPADPRTMRTPRSPGKIAQFLLKPPGWPMFVATVLAVSVSIIAGTAPGGYFVPTMLALALWMIILPVWFFRLLIWAGVRGYFKRYVLFAPRQPKRWLMTPVMLMFLTILLVARVPLYLTFWLSHGSMNALVQDVLNGAEPKTIRKRVGWYYVDDIKRTSAGVSFRVVHASSFDFNGFIWSTSPLPPVDSNGNQFSRFYGPWYTWHTSN